MALDDKPTPLPNRAPDSRTFTDKWRIQLRGCLIAVVLCALITFIASQWLIAFDAANPVMIYLLGVVVVALFTGAGRQSRNGD